MERSFDVVLWGATGFTGQLVAHYLTEHYGCTNTLRWALAGRNLTKLEQVRDQLVTIDPTAHQLPLLVGDSQDQAALESMAAQTQVICSTVGPYSKYGSQLVAACVNQQTHYCDITGELTWIRDMIDQHHEAAQAQKLRLVHCCGFDAIPSDLGCLMMQEAMLERYGMPCDEIRYYLGDTRGGFSGGTLASLMALMDQLQDEATRTLWSDPYALNPSDHREGPDNGDLMTVSWDSDQQAWISPYIMASINTRIVRRSNALQQFRYGHNFKYSEVTGGLPGPLGFIQATTTTILLDVFLGLVLFPPTRALLQNTMLPSPGDGPSAELQESGYFTIHLLAKAGEHRLKGVVKGQGDPGYRCTSRMLAESAICLAQDQASLPQYFGVLTPATAMGSALLNRLQQVDFTFEVLS